MGNNVFLKKIGSGVAKNLVASVVTTVVGCVIDRAFKVEPAATPETETPVTTEATEVSVTETDIPEVNVEVVE